MEDSKVTLEQSSLLTFSWEDICVDVDLKKLNTEGKPAVKRILENVSGIAKPGELLAIMGSSGAGKTTLLDTFNLRSKEIMSGHIKLNGHAVTSAESLLFNIAYVPQVDFFVETLTVREHLTFNAMLRLAKSMKKSERYSRIESVMNDFNLKKCENTLIGNPEKGLKGISTGERRRLAVATELLKDAKILIADEPTTGLDSFMATTMVECMKHQAKKGKTIIFTIHQPSNDIFHMFNKLCLLAEGRLAFYGTTNEASDFFTSQQLICPNDCNPAEFYIKSLSISTDKRQECLTVVKRLCDSFKSSEYQSVLDSMLVESTAVFTEKDSLNLETVNKGSYSAGFLKQVTWLSWRNVIMLSRSKVLFSMLIIIYLPLLLGFIYFQQDQMKENSIRNINGLMFFLLMTLTNQNIFSTLGTFTYELPILFKEYSKGLYSVRSYFVAKILSEFPFHTVIITVLVTIVYFMVNLNQEIERYVITCLIYILVCNIASAFTSCVVSCTPTIPLAIKIASDLFVPLLCFGGYYINTRSIPLYFLFMKYLSWFSYGYEVILISQWKGVGRLSCNANSTICPPTGWDGDAIIEYYGFKKDNLWLDIALLFILYGAFQIISCIALSIRARRFK